VELPRARGHALVCPRVSLLRGKTLQVLTIQGEKKKKVSTRISAPKGTALQRIKRGADRLDSFSGAKRREKKLKSPILSGKRKRKIGGCMKSAYTKKKTTEENRESGALKRKENRVIWVDARKEEAEASVPSQHEGKKGKKNGEEPTLIQMAQKGEREKSARAVGNRGEEMRVMMVSKTVRRNRWRKFKSGSSERRGKEGSVFGGGRHPKAFPINRRVIGVSRRGVRGVNAVVGHCGK